MSLLPLAHVQEEIKAILVRSFTSALLPVCLPMIFFFLRAEIIVFYPCLYTIVFVECEIQDLKDNSLSFQSIMAVAERQGAAGEI